MTLNYQIGDNMKVTDDRIWIFGLNYTFKIHKGWAGGWTSEKVVPLVPSLFMLTVENLG